MPPMAFQILYFGPVLAMREHHDPAGKFAIVDIAAPPVADLI
jgi:hypothetical protein